MVKVRRTTPILDARTHKPIRHPPALPFAPSLNLLCELLLATLYRVPFLCACSYCVNKKHYPCWLLLFYFVAWITVADAFLFLIFTLVNPTAVGGPQEENVNKKRATEASIAKLRALEKSTQKSRRLKDLAQVRLS